MSQAGCQIHPALQPAQAARFSANYARSGATRLCRYFGTQENLWPPMNAD
jgi:hypothetical protein